MTLGVTQRVEELSDRPPTATRTDGAGLTAAANGRPPFRMLVSLQQVVSESLGVGVNAKRTQREWLKLCQELGGELSVLVDASADDVAAVSGDRIAEGIARVRAGDISIEPGYDGRYGVVSVWPES